MLVSIWVRISVRMSGAVGGGLGDGVGGGGRWGLVMGGSLKLLVCLCWVLVFGVGGGRRSRCWEDVGWTRCI